MVDLPEPEPPTMNVVSWAGRKRETSSRTGMVGREGYANVTSCMASSPTHLDGTIFFRYVGRRTCLNRPILPAPRVGREAEDSTRVMREDIANFPLAKMINWGMHICRLDV